MTRKSVASSAAPSLGRAALRAVGAAVLGAGVWIGLAGPFGVTWGLLAVAPFVGWLIGSVARSGATASGSTASGPRVQAVAVGGALFARLVALVGVYLYSLAALPSLGPAGTSLSERIAATSIVSFYGQQLGPIDALEAAFLVLAAWWSAR